MGKDAPPNTKRFHFCMGLLALLLLFQWLQWHSMPPAIQTATLPATTPAAFGQEVYHCSTDYEDVETKMWPN